MGYPLDEELLMLILGSGNKNMSVETMAKKIADTLDASDDDEVIKNLLALKGVGRAKALAIAAALELGKRRRNHLGAHIRTPDDIVPYVKHYAMSQKEHFLAITLNGGHDIIKIHVVSVGTVNQTIIHPREVFVDAIKENASAIILCHNHPSGKAIPSDKDIDTTRNLIEVSKIIGITILDHIIIDCENFFSFMENKLLFSEEE
ncbi:MAG: DNA repair protein RadC [Treponema sp.]|nr:DNA repair protein RadC [Treponema sp.]